MLQLLLSILKILGIIVLVILGIILTVLLLVLLVPIRYRGDASFDGKPKGNVLVSWLLRLVTVRVDFDGSALNALVKVLWFRLFEQTLWSSSETEASAADLTADDFPMDDLADDGFFSDGSISENVPEPVVVEVTDSLEEAAETTPQPKAEPVREPQTKLPAQEKKTSASQESVTEPVKPAEPVQNQNKAKNVETPVQTLQAKETMETQAEEKKPFLERMAEKICSLVLTLVENGKTIYNGLTGKYAAGQEKIATVRGFIQNPENQKTLRLIWKQVLKLIRHILPTRLKGRVRFGFDDPATTGQILTYISPFYGVYAKSFSIEPVFDEKVMEGEIHLKGRIRLGTILWRVIRVLLNKNFRMLLKKLLKRNK